MSLLAKNIVYKPPSPLRPVVMHECHQDSVSHRRNHVQNEEGGASKKRSSSKKKRQGSVNESSDPESPRLQGIFRQPPTGQKRFVYLDPRQPKYGFRLEVGFH